LWYDWPYIFRYRRELKSLDNVLALTRGTPLSWTHLLSAIRPTDQVFTGVYQAEDDSQKFIGQIYQPQHMTSAHLNYLLQPQEADSRELVPLLEGLIKEAGCWGAKQVVAELEIDSESFPQFRQAGFSVLAKQRVYRCEKPVGGTNPEQQQWRIWNSDDISAMRSLYFTLVPPLIQPIEPLTRREMLGLVHYDEAGDLQAYADLVYGPIGVWVLPLIHPQVNENIVDLLAQMLLDLPDTSGKPVYLTARSYQPWVEQGIENLSAEPGPEQALLVRYMAMQQRVTAEFPFASFENGKPEPTVPLAPISNNQG
jgi:hypothetical protein